MVERSVRSLLHLESTASTSRVLNLRVVSRGKQNDPAYTSNPFFQTPALNAAIIVKHRLRNDEVDQFALARRTATKILVPIDGADLKLGARYVFIGQRHFQEALYQAFGFSLDPDAPDMRTLKVLDDTPTLDPFLLRELLRRAGLEPAAWFFDVSPADSLQMVAFAQSEIGPLVRMCFGEERQGANAALLARKLLANSADKDLDPLRRTMQLDQTQFEEGVFCWKAFLYYKWRLGELLTKVGPTLREIDTLKPRGAQTDETKAYLSAARLNIRRALTEACRTVKTTLGIYNSAYAGLTQKADPSAFRDFLLNAPVMFKDLGERLGAIEHLVSFWRFRFPASRLPVVTPEELTEMFMDFENSLGGLRQNEPSALPAPKMIAMM